MLTLTQSDPASLTQLGQVRSLPIASQWALRLAYLLYIWSARSRTRAALRRLDSSRLADLGLSPGAARSEAAKWFWTR
ncbi:DUF1127 domain-containing protein [Rhodobacteraceae bacterium D3-12]|nr:DUF1127 domain-containing protein [Rhodobacteraceae bacterium D3-12]